MGLVDRIGENRSIVAVSAWIDRTSVGLCGLFSIFLTLKYYPGLFYWDIIQQYNWVEAIANAIRAPALPPEFHYQWPIWNTILRVPIYLITWDFGVFILLGAFFFLYSLLELHRKLGASSTFIVTASLFVFTPLSGWLVLHGPHLFVTGCLFCFIACQFDGRAWRARLFAIAAILLRPEMALVFVLIALALLVARESLIKPTLVTLAACIVAVGLAMIKVSDHRPVKTMNIGPAMVGFYLQSQIPELRAPALTALAPDRPAVSAEDSLNMWSPPLQKGVNWDKLFVARTPDILSSVALLAAQRPTAVAAQIAERTKVFLFQRLHIAELGRTDSLPQAHSKIIRDSPSENIQALVSRHVAFHESRLGSIYTPIVFILAPLLFAGLMRNARLFAVSAALSASVLCFSLVYPTNEIRYYLPEIFWMIVLAVMSVTSLAMLLARTVLRRATGDALAPAS